MGGDLAGRAPGTAPVGMTVRPEDWLIVPVEARGARWGHVIALPGPDHPAGRFGVLEQGATALALGRLAAGDDEWGASGAVDSWTGSWPGASPASEALPRGSRLPGFRSTGIRYSEWWRQGLPCRAWHRMPPTQLRGPPGGGPWRGRAQSGVDSPSATLLVSFPQRVAFDDAAALALARALGDHSLTLSIGSPAEGLEGALASLHEAIDLARGRRRERPRGPQIR